MIDTIVARGVTFDLDTAQAVAALSVWHDNRNTGQRIRRQIQRDLCELLGEKFTNKGAALDLARTTAKRLRQKGLIEGREHVSQPEYLFRPGRKVVPREWRTTTS